MITEIVDDDEWAELNQAMQQIEQTRANILPISAFW
jgi:hypothetical protein